MALAIKNLPANAGDVVLLSREDPLEKEMATHSVFLPGELPRQRNMAGYSPCGRKESGTTEHTHTHTHTHTSAHVCDFLKMEG